MRNIFTVTIKMQGRECNDKPEHREEVTKEEGHLTQFCGRKSEESALVIVMSMLSPVALTY